jgi:hypothetical protein
MPEWVVADVFSMGGGIVLGAGVLAAVAGILGLVGGCIVRKKSTAAGVLMIVAGALCLVAFFNFVSMVLLVLGGIFALIKERPRPTAQYHPAQPYNQYAPYPPYPPYPPQQPAPPASENPPEPPKEQ